jgi:CubicO group peptidase (beta-lactamase class C family)
MKLPRGLLMVALLSCALVPTMNSAETQTRLADPALIVAIDELVKKSGITPESPGLAILVRGPGRLELQRGYGLANVKEHTAITQDTLFELASVTKTFTATAVLILHQQGRLTIDDDVRRHIPELPTYDRVRPISIRDLLQHTSGLPDYMDLEGVKARHKDYEVNEDYAAEFARQRESFPLSFATGAKYEYNNSNYMLLGLLVERVAKVSFGTFLRNEVLVPAGMRDSFVYESPSAVPRTIDAKGIAATGYERAKGRGTWAPSWGLPPSRHERLLTVGDGGLWTNLVDMARWDAALREGKLLKPDTMKMALLPSKTRDRKTNAYGLGWMLYPGDEGALNGYGHEGSWGGFETSYYRYLAGDRTTVLLSNRGDFDTDKFWYALNELVERFEERKGR